MGEIMIKVVYNTCYGGFGLSLAAMDRLVELGVEGAAEQIKLTDESFRGYTSMGNSYSIYGLKRHDPRLVQVVEELGAKANGRYANLTIEEISGNKYRIDEYDGLESVIEPDDIENEWIAAD